MYTGGRKHNLQPLTLRVTSIPSYPSPTDRTLMSHREPGNVVACVTGCLSEPVISLKPKLSLITSFSVRQSGSSKWPSHSSALKNSTSSSPKRAKKSTQSSAQWFCKATLLTGIQCSRLMLSHGVVPWLCIFVNSTLSDGIEHDLSDRPWPV